jgi:hypothetical protein
MNLFPLKGLSRNSYLSGKSIHACYLPAAFGLKTSNYSVSASYPSTVGTVTQKSSAGINLSGLEGNKATCNFDTVLNTRYENIYSNNSAIPTGVNAVNTLPSSFSIDRNTCLVTVDINQPGTYSAYVGIDIPGYYATSGSSGLSALTVPFSITIDGPLLTLSLPVNTYTWGESISKNLCTDLKLTRISLASSDVVEYVGIYCQQSAYRSHFVIGI